MQDSHRVVTEGGGKNRTHSDSKGMGEESFHRETCQMLQMHTRRRKEDLGFRD